MNAMTYNPQSCPLQITNAGKPHEQHMHSTNQPGLILPIIMLLIYCVGDSLDIECPIEGVSHMSNDASKRVPTQLSAICGIAVVKSATTNGGNY